MNFSREADDRCYELAEQQGRIFEGSVEQEMSSYLFIRSFVRSYYCRSMDDLFRHEYSLSELDAYIGIHPTKGKCYPKEVLYWMGYMYRVIAYLCIWPSTLCIKQIPISYLRSVYAPYHTVSPLRAIEEIFRDLNLEPWTPEQRIHKILVDTGYNQNK